MEGDSIRLFIQLYGPGPASWLKLPTFSPHRLLPLPKTDSSSKTLETAAGFQADLKSDNCVYFLPPGFTQYRRAAPDVVAS